MRRVFPITLIAALLALAVAFGAGYSIGGERALHLPTYTADGYVGADQASFHVGNAWFGFESSVAWTDRTGSAHEGGWPDCLPKLQEVKGVRFAVATLRWEDSGVARVVWVDCRNPT